VLATGPQPASCDTDTRLLSGIVQALQMLGEPAGSRSQPARRHSACTRSASLAWGPGGSMPAQTSSREVVPKSVTVEVLRYCHCSHPFSSRT
jgi:hypothetical protein